MESRERSTKLILKRIGVKLNSALGTAALALFVFSQPAAAACYAPNYGAYEYKTITNGAYSGIRAHEDFYSATVTTGQLVAHPMQINVFGGDFVGWGTRRGNSAVEDNGYPQCYPDYTAHWKLYVDGIINGEYFCYEIAGEIAGTEQGRFFNINYGDCNGTNKFRAYLDGTRKWCGSLTSSSTVRLSVGGEADSEHPNARTIDIYYHSIEIRLDSNSTWYAMPPAGYCFPGDSGYGWLHPSWDEYKPYKL